METSEEEHGYIKKSNNVLAKNESIQYNLKRQCVYKLQKCLT